MEGRRPHGVVDVVIVMVDVVGLQPQKIGGVWRVSCVEFELFSQLRPDANATTERPQQKDMNTNTRRHETTYRNLATILLLLVLLY